MDYQTFNQQIETLNKEVYRYQLLVNKFERISSLIGQGFKCNLSISIVDQQLCAARHSLKIVKRQIKRLEEKYYAQYPLTKDQYETVGFPSGVSCLYGGDKY